MLDLPYPVCEGKESRSGSTVYFLDSKSWRYSDHSDPPPADKVVKVPEMAESISEGTLKQWSKSKAAKSLTRAR